VRIVPAYAGVDADEHGSRLSIALCFRTSNARCAEPDVRAEQLSHTSGHLSSHLGIHWTALGQEVSVDPQQLCLEFGGVRDYPAAKGPRRPGDRHDRCGKQPTGQRLCGGQPQTAALKVAQQDTRAVALVDVAGGGHVTPRTDFPWRSRTARIA
jgi:hypothetical protein